MRTFTTLFLFSFLQLCNCTDQGEVLDISKVASDVAHEQTYDQSGDQKTFIPKGDGYFSEVKDGETTVWKSNGNERCDKVFLRRGKNVRILTLNVRTSSTSLKYFEEKNDGNWEVTDCFVADDLPSVNPKPVSNEKLETCGSCIRVD